MKGNKTERLSAEEARALLSKKAKPLQVKTEKIQSVEETMSIKDRTTGEEIMSKLFLRYKGYVEEHPDHFLIIYEGRHYRLEPVEIKK